MGSFSEFKKNRDQISKFTQSIDALKSIKGNLKDNGVETDDLNNQIKRANSVLARRLSGTNKWYGSIVRIDQETVNGVLLWRLLGQDGEVFNIPVQETNNIIKLPIIWQDLSKPINKYIEYQERQIGTSSFKIITYTENRTVNIIPFRTNKELSQYYLIKKEDTGLWATVGGYVEPSELNNPLKAALRELREETGAFPLAIRELPCGWLKSNTPEEYHSYTLPFIALIDPEFDINPSKNAIEGNWFDTKSNIDSLSSSVQKTIIQEAKSYLPVLLKEFGKKYD